MPLPPRPTHTKSNLLSLQAPGGVLESSRLRRISDPISIRPTPGSRMRHFFEGIYDLKPESHLTRFMETLLGDAGVGHMSKVYAYARMKNMVATMRYADLDAFYGAVLGVKRFSWERTDPSRYYQANTPAEWDEIDARDASYRGRIEAFSRAINQGATPNGIKGIASALLGIEVRLYESYLVLDETGTTSPETDVTPTRPRTWGEISVDFPRYQSLNGMTYGDIEGRWMQNVALSRTRVNDRAHFLLRPMRAISSEEEYLLRHVIERFKPVGTLMSINHLGMPILRHVPIRTSSADSTHWEAQGLVHGTSNEGPDADEVNHTVVGAFEVPRPAMVDRQANDWTYNDDVINVRAYREIDKELWSGLPDPSDHAARITGVPEFWTTTSASPGLWENWQRVEYATGEAPQQQTTGGRGGLLGASPNLPPWFGQSPFRRSGPGSPTAPGAAPDFVLFEYKPEGAMAYPELLWRSQVAAGLVDSPVVPGNQVSDTREYTYNPHGGFDVYNPYDYIRTGG